jgi:hypothetical protein
VLRVALSRAAPASRPRANRPWRPRRAPLKATRLPQAALAPRRLEVHAAPFPYARRTDRTSAASDRRSVRGLLPLCAVPRLVYSVPWSLSRRASPIKGRRPLPRAHERHRLPVLRLGMPPVHYGRRHGTPSYALLQSRPTTLVPPLAPTRHPRLTCHLGRRPSPERKLERPPPSCAAARPHRRPPRPKSAHKPS